MKSNQRRTILGVVVALALAPAFCGLAAADADLKGVIKVRSGDTMTVHTEDSRDVTVVLTAGTKVHETHGVIDKRHANKAVTALIPGLRVKVKGYYNDEDQLVAEVVSFSGHDLKTAQDIQAGLDPTQQQIQDLQKESAEHAAEIAAANKRFGELGEYNIMDEVTVYFGNGKAAIEDKYEPELMQLAQKAKGVTGYVIQVQGYASKVGSAAFNQKLSAERAQNVTSFLEQNCQIPLTNILAPGAMGTSEQVGSNETAEGQAENRRVVVRVLQNKGIAGS
jgi:outer membrane protein OmpA-like peptidoglycan-associated protein